MRLIGLDIIDHFKKKYPQSRKSMDVWISIARGTDFAHYEELKKAFNSVDYVAPNTIFDISGNKFRLIAHVDYGFKTVLIKKAMIHSEYERWNKK